MKYEQRICCFIDILGFKKHLDKTINEFGEDDIKKINSIKHILKLSKNLTVESGVSPSKVVTYFSDSIVISYKYEEPSQFFNTISDLLYLSFELINQGYLTRGSVVVGKLLHTSEYVFGPALAEAYRLESKVAKFPRIILSEEVLNIGLKNKVEFHSENEEKDYLMEILSLDDDGYYFIDYISKASSELNDPEYDLYYYITNIQRNHLRNLQNETDDVITKLEWLNIKLNKYILQVQDNVKKRKYNTDISELYLSIRQLKTKKPNNLMMKIIEFLRDKVLYQKKDKFN